MSDSELIHTLRIKIFLAVRTIAVVDARNQNFEVEPSDKPFGGPDGAAPIALAGTEARPRAVNIAYDRVAKTMDLKALEPLLDKCGKVNTQTYPLYMPLNLCKSIPSFARPCFPRFFYDVLLIFTFFLLPSTY